MEVKARLQRALQILEDAERVEMLSDIERDILLTELREAYAELKFGKTENGELKTENEEVAEEQVVEPTEESVVELPIAPIAPITPTEEEQDEEQEETEPEVEVELIFNEEEDEETENGKRKTENEELKAENEEVAEEQVVEPTEEPAAESVAEEPAVVEKPAEKDELSSFVSRHSSKSALLSLYEDAPTPVLGEQFHESPSVADTIACPKGVAESAPVASLREAIGLADKFMLIRELFDGNAEEYDKAIATLDKQQSFDDCIIYISENYTWSPSSAATKLVMELLERKYN